VLQGRAGAGLLDTYAEERRPVDAANIETALSAAMNHSTVVNALGLSSQQSTDENWEALRPLWSDAPDSLNRRHGVSQAIASHSFEFHSRASISDTATNRRPLSGTDHRRPQPIDAVRIYEPSTRPGSPLPHAWVEREGKRLPLGSLIHGGHFVLIAGEDGADWVEAALKIAAEHSIPCARPVSDSATSTMSTSCAGG